MEKGTKRTKEEQDQAPEEKDDPILDLAIEYVASGAYPAGIPKQKKRAVRKRAANLLVQDGEVFLQRKNRKVKVVMSVDNRINNNRRILQSCHSDPTAGHFGNTKTWRRVAERFYWKGMNQDVKELVKHCHTCHEASDCRLGHVQGQSYHRDVPSCPMAEWCE